jgi:hypothetical protein
MAEEPIPDAPCLECGHKQRHHAGRGTEKEPKREGCLVRVRTEIGHDYCPCTSFAAANVQTGLGL